MHRPSRDHIIDLLNQALDHALAVQQPAVRAHVARVRKADPALSPQDHIDRLEKQYLATVATLGGTAGAVAAAPFVGTAVAVPINIAEVGTFVEATTLYVLALAEIHGIHVNDLDRRRTLVLAILIGQRGSSIISKIAGRAGPHWARHITSAIPMSTIHTVNRALGKNFVTKYGTKQGILVLGRELPLGIGAVIGAVGNSGLGYMSVRAARVAFGPPSATYRPSRPSTVRKSQPTVLRHQTVGAAR